VASPYQIDTTPCDIGRKNFSLTEEQYISTRHVQLRFCTFCKELVSSERKALHSLKESNSINSGDVMAPSATILPGANEEILGHNHVECFCHGVIELKNLLFRIDQCDPIPLAVRNNLAKQSSNEFKEEENVVLNLMNFTFRGSESRKTDIVAFSLQLWRDKDDRTT